MKLAASIHWFKGLNRTPSLEYGDWRGSPHTRLRIHLLSTAFQTWRRTGVHLPSTPARVPTQLTVRPFACSRSRPKVELRSLMLWNSCRLDGVSSGAIIKPSPTCVVILLAELRVGLLNETENVRATLYLHGTRCAPVCLLILGVQSKWLNARRWKPCHTIVQGPSFLNLIPKIQTQMGLPPTGSLNAGELG